MDETSLYHLETPLTDEDILPLKAGDRVMLSGKIYTARDAAHKRFMETLDSGRDLPIPIKGQVIYYVGPSPSAPGRIVGSAGPTTSYRMDPYTPRLLELGLKGMMGKGKRSKEVIDAMVKYKGIYMAAIGGAGALVAKSIKNITIVAYEDLGPEAVREVVVEDMPLVVVNDTRGNDLYTENQKRYKK